MRLTSVVALALLLTACDGDIVVGTYTYPPAASAAASPTSSPSPSAGRFGAIEHATGRTDVVLRFEFIGGFVLPTFLATQAPIFTLYGDGSVIVRNPRETPFPLVGSVAVGRPFLSVFLTEDQIQALLADALDRGGLRVARADYSANQVMDLPTAVFTINAGGISKQVAITGLGMDIGSTPDDAALAAFLALSTRLENFDNSDYNGTASWSSSRYRGSLLEGQAGAPDAMPWPWTTIAPADFVVDPDPNGFPLPARALSQAEVQAMRLTFPYDGGFQGLPLIGPGDGRIYSLSLRPLLPDESK